MIINKASECNLVHSLINWQDELPKLDPECAQMNVLCSHEVIRILNEDVRNTLQDKLNENLKVIILVLRILMASTKKKNPNNRENVTYSLILAPWIVFLLKLWFKDDFTTHQKVHCKLLLLSLSSNPDIMAIQDIIFQVNDSIMDDNEGQWCREGWGVKGVRVPPWVSWSGTLKRHVSPFLGYFNFSNPPLRKV